MIRELKAYTNPLEQLIIIFKTVFHIFLTNLDNLTDKRNQSYIEYSMQEIVTKLKNKGKQLFYLSLSRINENSQIRFRTRFSN